MINCFGPQMSHLTIVGAAAHFVGKCGSVLMTILLGHTGGTGMPAAAVSPTIDQSVARARDASAASSITAAALIVATLIASTLIPTTLIAACLLVASILLVLALVALLVAARSLIRYLSL
jgi:hypothetical protein